MLRKMIVDTLVSMVVLGLILFLPAGTLAWPQGWALIIIFLASGLIIGVWLLKTDPELLAARQKSPLSKAQKPQDRAIIAVIFVVFFAWLVFMPLDAKRLGWSHTPLWAQVLGAVLIVVTYWGWVAVLKANSFASVEIRVQAERNQKVISTGPYAVVRHPMYAYIFPFMIGVPLLLGSLWGLWGIVLIFPLLAARTLREEAMLFDGLPGYREYAGKVRYRFVPGLW